MHVISRKKLLEFLVLYPDAQESLLYWYRLAKTGHFRTFADLKDTFGSVDYVKGLTVFDLGGNKFRLIAAVHYNRQKIYVRAVLTHKEYDLEKWKE
jgi:mRNA interferase HigB